MLEKDKMESAQSSAPFVQETRDRIKDISIKLQRLLDGYLDQDIDRQIYREERAKLLSEKKTLEEKIINLEQKQIGWIAPMSEWIEKAANLEKIAQDSNLYLKRLPPKKSLDCTSFWPTARPALAGRAIQRIQILRQQLNGPPFRRPIKQLPILRKVRLRWAGRDLHPRRPTAGWFTAIPV